MKSPRKRRAKSKATTPFDPVEIVKELFPQSSLLSMITDQPIKAILEMPRLKPKYPDLVIRHQEQTFHFEFFAKNNKRVPYEMGVSYLAAAERYEKTIPIAVWVGDKLIDFEPRIDEPNLKFLFRIVDIREPLENDPRFTEVERQILSRLKTVHQAQGGLFTKLLKLTPRQHQHEFVRIAT